MRIFNTRGEGADSMRVHERLDFMRWAPLSVFLLSGAAIAQEFAHPIGDVIALDEWPFEFLGSANTFAAETVTIDDFSAEEVYGVSVYVENTLEDDSSEDVALLLKLMEAHLTLLENMVSADIFTKLVSTDIWLTDNNCRSTAALYHNKKVVVEYLERNGRPAEMAGGIEFCRVDVLVERDRLSAYLIHELAHGFHDHYLPDAFDNEIHCCPKKVV